MSVIAATSSSGPRSTLSPSPSVPPPPLPAPQRPRTVLPPLSSLSLPGSPALGSTPSLSPAAVPPPTTLLQNELHHPRPTYPPRRPSEHLLPLLHALSPPTSTAPSVAAVRSGQPDPEVYARAYALLRSRLLGPASSNSLAPSAQELRKVADAASAALLAKEKGEKGEWELRKRRSRSWEESVLQEGKEGWVKRVKQGQEEEDVAFFDNAAPCFCPSSAAATAVAAEPQRHRSFSPPSSFPPTAPHPALSSSSRPSLLHLGRKRSFSLPPSSSSSSSSACPHPHSSSLPPSRSLSQLAAAGQARQEALRSVMKSFEAVRACRGDWGGRRLGGGGGAVEQQH